MQTNIDELEPLREDDDRSTDRREAISVALVPWKSLEVEVFRQENRSPNGDIRSDETFEKMVIKELLAERREFYEVMMEVRDFLRDISNSKTISDAKPSETKASGPCGEDMTGSGEEPQCSKSPVGTVCDRRARFIRWYINGRNKKALMRDKR